MFCTFCSIIVATALLPPPPTPNTLIFISLILAIMLFFYVDNESTAIITDSAEVLYGQKVEVTYNNKAYVIEGLPKTVDVTLIGRKVDLYLAKQLAGGVVTADLSNLSEGMHTITLDYDCAINSVDYKLSPSVVNVTVYPKVSQNRTATIDIINMNKLDKKLSIDNVELNNSDIVKITTNKNQTGPSREWLNIVKTTQAKNKIKSFFNKTSKEEQIAFGKESLEKELRRQKISITEFLSKENIEQKLKELKLDTLDDLYLNIGNGKYSSKYVIKNEEVEEKVIPVPTIKVLSKESENDIIVGEQDSIKTHIANCCLPIPGDNIVGYITKTNGISIHRRRCPNVKEEDRIIKASFTSSVKNKYYSKIIIESNTSTNLITDIVQTCSNASVFVENISVISKSNNLVYSTLVSIKDKEELESLINSLSHIKHITSVYRDLSV